MPSGQDDLTEALVAISRSSSACRASTVACCLAYHEIIRRERSRNAQSSLALAYRLMPEKMDDDELHNEKDQSQTFIATSQGSKGSNGERDELHPAYQWYSYAVNQYQNASEFETLEQRLNTLLNLRWSGVSLFISLFIKDAT